MRDCADDSGRSQLKVLVVIPTHDRLEFLGEAMASVEAQTRPADQLVITGNVGPGVISNAGIEERLNRAIEDSDCDAFSVLCDDDTLAPEFLERTVHAMEREQVDIVYTDCTLFGDRTGDASALGQWTKENIDRNTVPLITSLCTKSAWKRAGGYQPCPFFDWDFWWRCFYTGATAFWLREHLWNYRIHPGQQGNTPQMAQWRTEILARHDALRSNYE